MKKSPLLLLPLLFAACTTQQQTVDNNPVLTIEGGQVQGVELENSVVYRGIPYAAAPVGDLRWQRPQPVEAWEGVMQADTWSCASWQAAHDPNDGNYGVEFYDEDPEFSEDCLYLNVWTPKGAAGQTDKKLPVAMWIHGGAYHAGWGFEKEFDGEAWTDRDVILVTINYRLGIFGFLSHPLLTARDSEGISGNYGIYDQLKALQWVHDNIAQFGGDPDNVTIFGQSAGGGSVRCLVSSPLAKPLINKAIIMSAGGLNRTLGVENNQEAADQLGVDIYEKAGYTTLEQFMNADWQTLYDIQQEYVKATRRWALSTPHIDGKLLTEDFSEATLNNTLADIPYMMGSVANDMPGLNEGLQDFAAVRDSLSANPTYIYYFDAAPPTDGRPALTGSFHSSELWSVFHTQDRSWRPFSAADNALSERMVDYWTNFVKFGNPNGAEGDAWKPYSTAEPYVQMLQRAE